jgi:hypothetical protein
MEQNRKIVIYSFYYKETIIPVEDELYMPVMVGNALSQNKTGMAGDDTGDSISEKNKYFSELTGIYWVWKNTKHDVTGCCHYRRYFSASEEEPADLKIKRALYYLLGPYKKRYGLIYTGNISRFSKKVIHEKGITEILKTHDAILPQKRKLRYSVEEHYRRYHNSKDLEIIRGILSNNHPDYVAAFETMLKNKFLYANNMFILPSAHFSRFMEWWFSVLFKFEQSIDLNTYTGYQQRVLGFIAERLLTTWFIHENIKIKELPVIYFKKLKHKS